MMKKVLWTMAIILVIFVIALIGGSFYMLDYSLATDPNRMDTDSCYRQQFETYPESPRLSGNNPHRDPGRAFLSVTANNTK